MKTGERMKLQIKISFAGGGKIRCTHAPYLWVKRDGADCDGYSADIKEKDYGYSCIAR